MQKYWDRCGRVRVTNLRDWALVGRDADGHQVTLEQYRLALSEDQFWRADPAALAAGRLSSP